MKQTAFKDWCKYNIYKLTEKEFLTRHGISPRRFRKKYWTKGLQDAWLKFIKEISKKGRNE